MGVSQVIGVGGGPINIGTVQTGRSGKRSGPPLKVGRTRGMDSHSPVGRICDVVESEVVVEPASNDSEGLAPGTGVACGG